MLNSKAQKRTLFFTDKGYIDFKSKAESHRALILALLKRGKQIKEWDYEPETHRFYPPHIPDHLAGKQFGVRTYKTDFRVVELSGRVRYEEVKNGWITTKDRTKLKCMATYYPEKPVWLVVDYIPKGNTTKSRAKLHFLKTFEPYVERIYEMRPDRERLGLK